MIEDWTKERISELRKNGCFAEEAALFIEQIAQSPYLDGYLAVKTTIDNINQELKAGAAKITSGEGEDKNFDRSHKYITEMQPYYEQLEYFRKKLSPQELEEVNERPADLLDEARLKLKRNGKV